MVEVYSEDEDSYIYMTPSEEGKSFVYDPENERYLKLNEKV